MDKENFLTQDKLIQNRDNLNINSNVSNQLSDRDIRDLTNKLIAKRNRTFLYLFYGMPILTVVFIIFVFFTFIAPAISRYFEIKDYFQVLDDNLSSVKSSVVNLNKFYTRNEEISAIDSYLKTQIPEKSRLGLILNQLLKNASDFSLEGQIGVSPNKSDTTNSQNNGNLYFEFGGPSSSNKSSNNKNIDNQLNSNNEESFYLKDLSSGESKFLGIDMTSGASNVYVLTISLTVRGTKSKFFDFLKSLSNFTPKLNIVGIDYKVIDLSDDPSIEALIKFESYVVRDNPDYKAKRLNIFSVNDPAILSRMEVEEFDILKEIYTVISNEFELNQNPSNMPTNSTPTSTSTPSPTPSLQQDQPYGL